MTSALSRNRAIYERAVTLIQRGLAKRPVEESVALIEGLAHFATHAHTGLFRDDRLENWLTAFGQEIEPIHADRLKVRYPYMATAEDKPLLLHIATTLYKVGGHVNYLERIAEWDNQYRHVLVVTRQEGHPYKLETEELFDHTGGGVIFLGGNYAERTSALKGLCHLANEVLLHHHTDDPTVLLALSGFHGQVGMINHSDHTFWLGASVVHHTLEFRQESLYVSQELRGIGETWYVPLPVKEPKQEANTRAVRQSLGIPEEAIVFVSMGSLHKFRPWKDRDFFQWMHVILENMPESYLLVVGIDPDNYCLEPSLHGERIRLIAPTPKPEPYLAASDFVIDPIPNGSFTAVLEGCALGCIPVLPTCTHSLLNTSQDPALSGYAIQAKDPLEVVQQVALLSKENRIKLVAQLSRQMLKYHFRRGWMVQYREMKKGPAIAIAIDHDTMADLHNIAFPKAVKKLAQAISDAIGGQLNARDMRFLQQLWMYSGLSFGQSAKWVLSRKWKQA